MKAETGFYCEKHRLWMFSLKYCPMCVSERLKRKEAEKNEA